MRKKPSKFHTRRVHAGGLHVSDAKRGRRLTTVDKPEGEKTEERPVSS